MITTNPSKEASTNNSALHDDRRIDRFGVNRPGFTTRSISLRLRMPQIKTPKIYIKLAERLITHGFAPSDAG